jgi:hypothetical protein
MTRVLVLYWNNAFLPALVVKSSSTVVTEMRRDSPGVLALARRLCPEMIVLEAAREDQCAGDLADLLSVPSVRHVVIQGAGPSGREVHSGPPNSFLVSAGAAFAGGAL